jgi:hypothetical protein
MTGGAQDPGRRDVFSQMSTTRGPAVSDPVTYTAVLPVAEETVLFVSGLLAAERRRRGTRGRRRALGCYRQAVLVLRWFSTAPGWPSWPPTTGSAARRPTGICTRASTSSPRPRRGCAARCWPPAPPAIPRDGGRHADPHRPLLGAGPTARADRPERRVDLWWSGKHAAHGGNVQVIAAPDGWPIWTSGCGPAASTTPPRCAPTPRRCRCWPSGPTRTTPPWPTWATRASGRR